MRAWLVLALGLAGCGGMARPDGNRDARALGMNDITMLLPLPADLSAPALLTIDGAVPRDLFTQFVIDPMDVGPKLGGDIVFESIHVVAVRFDLCLHDSPRECADGEDGRLRLVLQPLYKTADATFAHDIALHAFYPIPVDQLDDVITELRALGQIQNAPLDAPLMVSPALSASPPNPQYAERLNKLVTTYARAERLVRLTLIGQNKESAAFAWVFRGIAKGDAGWADIKIPELRGTVFRQSVLVAGGDVVYNVEPGADSPVGFLFALDGQRFATATPDEKRYAIEALATIENPTMRGAGNTQCIGCHLTTPLLARRAATAGVDPATLRNRYISTYNTRVDSIASTDPRVVRALGWAGGMPAISQRVANDTAELLEEIERRFP